MYEHNIKANKNNKLNKTYSTTRAGKKSQQIEMAEWNYFASVAEPIEASYGQCTEGGIGGPPVACCCWQIEKARTELTRRMMVNQAIAMHFGLPPCLSGFSGPEYRKISKHNRICRLIMCSKYVLQHQLASEGADRVSPRWTAEQYDERMYVSSEHGTMV